MSSIVYEILNTEITHIPKSLEHILGRNFNNALCNGITWLFILWIILRSCYDHLINVLLRHLGFPQYLRVRLSSSIWVLVCSGAFFAFYISILYEQSPWSVLNFLMLQHDNALPYQTSTFAILCSFFLFSGCSQGVLFMQRSSFHCLVKFVALTTACSSAYILGFVDIPFALAALVALTGIFEELAKLSYSLLDKKKKISNIFISSIFASSLVLFCLVNFILIPVGFLIPLGMRLFSSDLDLLLLLLFTSLLCWLNLVIYKSALLNLIFHQLYHLKKKDKGADTASSKANKEEYIKAMPLICIGNMIECSLFPPRCDDGFVIAYLRSEAKRRKNAMLAKRKPKNKNMIIQTLKCMMTIKKKLSEKKLSRSKSEESADESEGDQLIESESDDSDQAEESLPTVKASAKMMELPPKPEAGNVQLEGQEQDFEAVESEIKSDNLDKQVSHEDLKKGVDGEDFQNGTKVEKEDACEGQNVGNFEQKDSELEA